MADHVQRSAARLAALIAVPVAVLVGVGTFFLLDRSLDAPGAETTPSVQEHTATPQPVRTGPVPAQARELTETQANACRLLIARLPATLGELPQRPVTDGHEQNAAFGEPAVQVACGVPEAQYEPTDTVFPLDEVCWHAAEEEDRSVWTTLDREVPVQVTVPTAYEPPAAHVQEVVPAVLEAVLSTDAAPAGCG